MNIEIKMSEPDIKRIADEVAALIIEKFGDGLHKKTVKLNKKEAIEYYGMGREKFEKLVEAFDLGIIEGCTHKYTNLEIDEAVKKRKERGARR